MVLASQLRAGMAIRYESQLYRVLAADYHPGQGCFMNPESYEQVEIPLALLGAQTAFLESGMKLAVEFVEGRPVNVLMPDILEARVADTAPASHQQQDSNFKPAKLENGVEVMVPQFVKTGDVIRLDSQALKYVDRAKRTPGAGAT
jgi:elongation factor P